MDNFQESKPPSLTVSISAEKDREEIPSVQSSTNLQVAVLMACHNRKTLTLHCLDSLRKQELPEGVSLRVVLVDDGSTDGTKAAIKEKFPEVEVIDGDGSLYWSRGMLKAWENSIPCDFYLWLNDDVQLYPNAIASLFETHKQMGQENAIVTGSISVENSTGTHYGGRLFHKLTFTFQPMEAPSKPVGCHTMTGNFVLVSESCRKSIGLLDPFYVHGFADYDYGLRASKKGISIWLAPGVHGVCEDNSFQGSYRDTSLPLKERWRLLMGPKGLPPRMLWKFVRDHASHSKIIFWLAPCVKSLMGIRGRTI